VIGRWRGRAKGEPAHAGSHDPDHPGPERAAVERGLVASHPATAGRSPVVARIAVRVYHVTAFVLGRLPRRLSYWILATAIQGSYLLWPSRRRWANLNFGHVLGLPRDHPAVRSLALAAHRHYAEYMVELMRLPDLDLSHAAALVELQGVEALEALRARGSVILAAAHVGNNELVAAGIASLKWPISVLADDSALPELFEYLAAQRERLGVRIIPWRNLREVYRVLKRGEMLGLLVDWGYRTDGIPVRLCGVWTTLPSGPASLAARTGATILPVVSRRRPDGTFLVSCDEPIRVASNDPAELARATQAIADALGRVITAAPEQWYSFKPMWPETADERDELARRAPAMLAGAGEVEA